MISDIKNRVSEKNVYESYNPLITRVMSNTVTAHEMHRIRDLDTKISKFDQYLIKNLNSTNDD